MCRRLRNRVWTFCQYCDEVFIYPDHYYASDAVYQHTGIEQCSKPRTRPCHVQWAQPIKCVDAGSEDRCAKGTCKKCLRPEDRWLSRTARKRLGKTNGRQEGTYERHLNLWEIEQDEDDRRVFEWAKECRRQLLQLDMISFKRLTYWTLRDLLFCVVGSAHRPSLQDVTAMDDPQRTDTLSARSSFAAVEARRGVSPGRAASSHLDLLKTEDQITSKLSELPRSGVPTKKGAVRWSRSATERSTVPSFSVPTSYDPEEWTSGIGNNVQHTTGNGYNVQQTIGSGNNVQQSTRAHGRTAETKGEKREKGRKPVKVSIFDVFMPRKKPQGRRG